MLLFCNGKVLTAKRAFNTSNGGLWEFPGGKQKSEETKKACIIREIREELGIEISPIIELTPFSNQNISLTAFICLDYQGIMQPLEHEELRFITFNELDLLQWSDADKSIVTYLKNKPPILKGRFPMI